MEIGLNLLKDLSIQSQSKILLLVIDGLGGLPDSITRKTELETAKTPNMDRLAYEGNCGLLQTVAAGITPGSAPGHLGLFGYDPLSFVIGRGVLEALGMDFDLKPGDIAARGNFCTLDKNGMISDRRAGRISTDEGKKLCAILEAIEIDGVKIIVQSVREHRLVTVFRGAGLDDELNDSDPQLLGVPPRAISPLDPRAAHTARIVNQFLVQARERLASHRPANMILLRGFSKKPDFPGLGEIYKLKAAAIASYPMYRGLAKVVGMDVLKTGAQLSDELSTLEQNYKSFDYFFLHVKGADSAGEDGDFKRKVSVIEEVDKAIPRIMDLKPEVLIITGDHSTPAAMSAHSWHPVPCLLYSKWCRPDGIAKFGEAECRTGSLGQMPASSLMPLAMAHAFKLTKFGA